MLINKEKLLSQFEGQERIVLDKILDKAEESLKRHKPVFTNFLNPHHLHLGQQMLEQIRDLKYMLYGGYKQAERQRLAAMPDYYIESMVDSPLVLLNISGQFKFQSVSHRDFLGAILGTGIKRAMVGDLVLYQGGCQAIIAPEIKDYLLCNLEQVHQIGVEVTEISFDRLKVEPQRVKKIKSTVASLRLDSVASSGFGTSRTKMSKIIEQGKVKVNWQVVEDPAYFLNDEDLLSIRGRGRVEIDELRGESRKGRIKLTLKRYL
ncbi:MAG: photosystem II S4 domain protein [Bacillota bacterium]